MKPKTALIIGATGATGSELVKQLLENESYGSVHIFVRRAVEISHPKLQVHIVDFNQLDSWKDKLQGDVLFSALGTTRRAAGSKDVQYQIDYTYQHDVAEAASQNGVSTLLLVSSTGSNAKSPFFYPKTKGKLEEAVSKMDFKQVHIFQPPILDRGAFARKNEKTGIKIINFLNKLCILRSQKPLPVDFLAEQMIKVAEQTSPQKVHSYNPKEIWGV